MKLVCDVWHPILDVLSVDFLLNNEPWGEYMMKSTAITLSWLITYHLNLPNPKESMNNPMAIDAVDKTMAISKGDIPWSNNQDWPPLRIPEKWGPKMGKVSSYGELKGLPSLHETNKEELEIDIMEECKRENSLYDSVPIALPPVLDTMTLEQQAIHFQGMLKARSTALETFSKQAEEKIKELSHRSNTLARWLKESQNHTEKNVSKRDMFSYLERFYSEAQKMFEEVQARERDSRVEGSTPSEGMITTLEVIGSFALWVEYVKKQGLLMDLVEKYNSESGHPLGSVPQHLPAKPVYGMPPQVHGQSAIGQPAIGMPNYFYPSGPGYFPIGYQPGQPMTMPSGGIMGMVQVGQHAHPFQQIPMGVLVGPSIGEAGGGVASTESLGVGDQQVIFQGGGSRVTEVTYSSSLSRAVSECPSNSEASTTAAGEGSMQYSLPASTSGVPVLAGELPFED